MEVFEGIGLSREHALAAAALVKFDFGIASLTPQRLRRISERLKNQQDQDDYVETDSVILVSQTLPSELLYGEIPGIEIIGVVIGDDLSNTDIETGIPIVAGLGDAFINDVYEDDLILVDGSSGRVYLGPDAETIARYQNKKIRKRYFISGVHLEAKTISDNRIIHVYCEVKTLDDVRTAMENGADGIYLPADNTLFAGCDTTKQQLSVFTELIDIIAGLPMIIDMSANDLAITSLLKAGAQCPIAMVAPSDTTRTELQSEIDMTKMFSEPEDTLGDISWALAFDANTTVESLPGILDPYQFVIIEDYPFNCAPDCLFTIMGMAKHINIPVISKLTYENWQEIIEDIVRLGVDILIVHPDAPADVKDAVRTL